jgi:16S rRNA (guanine527-N7)-methyltransferase
MLLIQSYFPHLDHTQRSRFQKLIEVLPVLNQQVNVISRKDIGSLEEKHILHSLAIAKKFTFTTGCSVTDVGTGGGFPGIPLAIFFPQAHFTLVDSIEKKIRLVREIIDILELPNATAIRGRMEKLDLAADFVVSRAVAQLSQLERWTRHLIRPGQVWDVPNGLISLKGGDLELEIQPFPERIEVYPISTWFDEPFFSTKKIVYLKK